MKQSLGLVLLALMLLLWHGGCASPERSVVDDREADEAGYTVAWARHVAVARDQQIRSAEVLGDLLIIVEEERPIVTAVSLRDGEIRWRMTLPTYEAERLFAPVRVDDRIVINSSLRIYQIDAEEGRLRRRGELPHGANAGVALSDYDAIVGAPDGRVYAYDLRTGQVQWERTMTGPVVARPLTFGPYAFVTDRNGRWVLFSVRERGRPMERGRAFDGIVAEATADERGIYVASLDRNLYAVDVEGVDQTLWRYTAERPLREGPRLVGGLLFQPISGEGLVAFDTEAARPLWSEAGELRPVTRQGEDRIVLFGRNGLRMVDRQDGRLRDSLSTLPLHTALEGPDQSIVLVTDQGRTMRLNPRR